MAEHSGRPHAGAQGAPPVAASEVRRVRYRENMVLTVGDLQTDQRYHDEVRHRHNIGGHDWGVIRGLNLTLYADRLVLEPGFAIARDGRELIVPSKVVVPLESNGALAEIFKDEAEADVWLAHEELPPGNSGHKHSLDTECTDSCSAGGPALVVSRVRGDGPPSQPKDGVGRGAVYIGRIGSGLPVPDYAILRGENLEAPSGSARLIVGSDSEDPNLRFAIRTPAGEERTFVNRVWLDRDRNVSLGGPAVLHGDVAIAAFKGPKTEPDPCNVRVADIEQIERSRPVPGLVFPRSVPTPTAATPWSVYQTDVLAEDAPTQHQLRFEIPEPVGQEDPSLYRFGVGTSDGAPRLSPTISVDVAGNVRIRGKLQVNGNLKEGPVRADPNDPRFVAGIVKAWDTGLSAAAGEGRTTGLHVTIAYPGGGNRYQVTLLNLGDSTLQHVNLQQALPTPGSAIPVGTLTKGQSRPVDVTFDSNLSRPFFIEVWAIGFTPLLRAVIGTHKFEVTLPDVG